MIGLIINGRQLPNIELERGFEIPSFSFSNEYIEVPGRPGAIKTRRQLKPIDFDLPLIYKNHHDKRSADDIAEEITGWINYYDAVPLQFTGKDWYWRAEFDGPFNIAINTRGFVTFVLNVRLADPYKYSAGEKTVHLPASSSATFVANEGTADTHPKFRIVIPSDMTRLSIENLDNLTPQGTPKQITLGVPESPEQTPVDPLTLVMHDTMRSTANWQTATEVDNGHIAGEMGVNQYGFYPDKYGHVVDAKRWQGPAMIRGIGQPLQDFRADIFIRNMNIGGETGMVEVYFRDANGRKVAKMVFADPWINQTQNKWQIMIGSWDYHTQASQPGAWNDFDGIIRIERVGKVWRPYIAKIVNGVHVWRLSTIRYTDNFNESMAPITHIQVGMRIYPLSRPTEMAIREIKIYKVNQSQDSPTTVPVSFKAGDVVEVDTASGLVLLNGETRMDLVSLHTDFFSLIPGLNRIRLSPANLSGEVTFPKRYL